MSDKNTGYYWTRTFSNGPDRRRGYVMEDDFQRSNETGNPVINTSRYGNDENTQESQLETVKDLVKQIILIITQAMVVTF